MLPQLVNAPGPVNVRVQTHHLEGEMMESWFYNLTNMILRLLVNVLTQWEVSGAENVPLEGPLIVVANHISFLDGVYLAMVIPRHLHFFMKVKGGLDLPVIGGFIGLWGAFPVRRGVVDRKALGRSLDLLKQDEVLGIFPEGTRGRGADTHKLKRAKAGVTVIAIRSGAPILPVGITGTEHPLSRRSGWFGLRRPKVRINIGEPFTLPDYEGQFNRQTLFTATSDVMYRIADLLPPEYRGYYADKDRPMPEDVQRGRGRIRHLIRNTSTMTA